MCRTSVRFNPHSQAGITVLALSLTLLLLATLVVVAVSRTAITEQRIAANETRARQAFEAAQAGLDHALAYYGDSTAAQGVDKNNDNVADVIAAASLGSGASYRVVYCDPLQPLPATCPATPPASATPAAMGCTAPTTQYFNTPVVLSCGWSDDETAKKSLVMSITGAASLAGPVTTPLISRGAVNVTGSANVLNYYDNLTIWTGQSLNNRAATGKTYVRADQSSVPNPSVEPPPDPPPGCNNPGRYLCMTQGTTIGPDVIESDAALANLSGNELFRGFMGTDYATYKATVATHTINANQLGTLAGIRNATIVVEGTPGITGGTYGTRAQPVVLVINGNFNVGGNFVLYGVLYVRNNLSAIGNPKIYGSAIIEGEVSGTGNMSVIHDRLATSNAANVGKPGILPGSWRDWL